MIREPSFLPNGHQKRMDLSLNHEIPAAASELTWILTSKPAHAHANLGDSFVWLIGNDGFKVGLSYKCNLLLLLKMLDCNSGDGYSMSGLYAGAAISEQALAYATPSLPW